MAKQSIAAQQAEAKGEAPKANLPAQVGNFQLPALFGKNAGIEVVPRFNVPYLLFAQPAAKDQFRDLMMKFPGIEDGDPVLMLPAPEKPIRPEPLKVMMLAAQQYYVIRDTKQGGKIISAHKKPRPGSDEYMQLALIVFLPDRAVPCGCLAKTVKCAAFQELSVEIKKSQEPDWIKNGEAHAAAVAACSEPFARVVATVSMGSKVGRGSGQPYKPTRASIAPSTSTEWALLAPLQTPEGMKVMQTLADSFEAQLQRAGIQDD